MKRLIFHKKITNTQVSRIRKTFTNGSSATVKFTKTMMSMMVQLEGSILEALGILDLQNRRKTCKNLM